MSRAADRRLFFISFLLFSIACTAHAQLQTDESFSSLPGAAMRMGFGARGMAMGNSLSAVYDDGATSYYNPALVPFQPEKNITASYGLLSLDRSLNFLTYTVPLKPNAGLSLSIINSGVSNIDGRNSDGIQTGTTSTAEDAFMLSFGIRPKPNFSFGITIKVYYNSLYQGVSSTTAAFDMGIVYIPAQDITCAVVVQDINGHYKWDSSSLYGEYGKSYIDDFPLRKRISIAWSPASWSTLVTGEFEYIGSDPMLRFGTEVFLVDAFALRAGIDQILLNGEMPAKPSLGFTFHINIFDRQTEFQYAYVFEPSSPSGISMLSIGLNF
ncbi:MAG: hypothetical protein WAV76_15110 [Bacteroidota bacterium]